MEQVCLPMKRFLQDKGCCAYAAAASVGNYYDKRITYELVCSIKKPDGANGLYTPEIADLLNTLGFKNVHIITADLEVFDFLWQDISKKQLIKNLRQVANKSNQEIASYYAKWLSKKGFKNQVSIDANFGDHIREYLSFDVPVMASFNWNLFFQYPKCDQDARIDPIRGDSEFHEVVCYGFNNKGVRILDSHHELYKRKLKKFAKGRYHMKWETLMTVLGQGDLIIPGDFNKEVVDELVSKY